MLQAIIKNHTQFWTHIGAMGEFLNIEKEYFYTRPSNLSWPSKVFGITEDTNLTSLQKEMEAGNIPPVLTIEGNEELEQKLASAGFKNTSTLTAMGLEIENSHISNQEFSGIFEVEDKTKADIFARIATEAFGYEVKPTTIYGLLRSDMTKIFVGKYRDDYATCGIVFSDTYGNSGLHMIGTLNSYRGLGLGKLMTKKLIEVGSTKRRSHILLTASQAGKPLYSKLGFKTYGPMKTFELVPN